MDTRDANPEIIASTTRMRETIKLIEKAAKSEAPTILLEGESGTGKNTIARIIHNKSRRADRPFMEINCASLPENLIESELFGHEKGAFTDAHHLKRGLFEVARGGTVFLDEIAEMSLQTQAKLLQVVESHKFRRVGGLETFDTNVRMITATSVNLREAVATKRFREDLYFRLQLIPIEVPALRDRGEDIPLLAQFFIEKFNRNYKKQFKGLAPDAEVFLKAYPWPGNVRELRNTIERIMILENDTLIRASHLPEEIYEIGLKEGTAFASSLAPLVTKRLVSDPILSALPLGAVRGSSLPTNNIQTWSEGVLAG